MAFYPLHALPACIATKLEPEHNHTQHSRRSGSEMHTHLFRQSWLPSTLGELDSVDKAPYVCCQDCAHTAHGTPRPPVVEAAFRSALLTRRRALTR